MRERTLTQKSAFFRKPTTLRARFNPKQRKTKTISVYRKIQANSNDKSIFTSTMGMYTFSENLSHEKCIFNTVNFAEIQFIWYTDDVTATGKLAVSRRTSYEFQVKVVLGTGSLSKSLTHWVCRVCQTSTLKIFYMYKLHFVIYSIPNIILNKSVEAGNCCNVYYCWRLFTGLRNSHKTDIDNYKF